MNNKSNLSQDIDLNSISKEKLFELRIYQLNVSLEKSELQQGINKLYEELEAKGLTFRPLCYLTDEWGCPNKVPIIGIPFYLAHNRLKQLEEQIMLEVEGGNQTDFMKLLRHEAGHAYNYAYRLYRRPKWRELFGSFSLEYNNITYKPRPYSKRYVRHLDDWYAQSHPDEDFAETFAVWLTPNSNWQKTYKGWPALKKLVYLNKLMSKIANKTPAVATSKPEKPAHKIQSLIRTYYDKRKKQSAHEYPDFYDGDLKEIFSEYKTGKTYQKASAFLRNNKNDIMDTITYWTAENKYTINQLLKDLINRCNELKLVVSKRNQRQAILDISTYLTTMVMNYYYTGTFIGLTNKP